MATKFKTIYNHADPVSPHGDANSLTDQQYVKDCDINHIMRVYGATGKLPVAHEGVSGDFSSVGDFQSCLDRINKARDEFASLPSEIRSRFGNDPAAYVDFVLDPRNGEECIRLGLREKAKEPEDTAVDVLKRIEKSVTPKGEGAA